MLHAVALAIVCALVASPAALAETSFGANDDTGKFQPDAGTAFYEEMAALGLRQAVLTVRWLPSDPLALADRPVLDLTVAAARRAGLEVVFATYPYPPREIQSGMAQPAAFGDWLAELARAYPEVRQFVVGNEPNQPAFWRPQFVRSVQRSARAFGPFLAAGYDALEEVDPELTVVGVGLSPRGNDRPRAKSNVSTSPIRFLAALGRWYRASGRTKPLMDGFSFHPYPNVATDPLTRGYLWPNAGFVNLARVKQALWDAFAGTGQPTTRQGLLLYLDEVGWQVGTSGGVGYSGFENVRVTTEAKQARIYGDLVRRALCDPDVAQVNLFGFRDDGLRTGFQAGLQRADGTLRASAEVVRTAIANPVCTSTIAAWRPARSVVGAKPPRVISGVSGLAIELRAAEGATARACILSGMQTLTSARRLLASRGASPTACIEGTVRPRRRTTLRLARIPGVQTLAVRLAAETNADRSTTTIIRLR